MTEKELLKAIGKLNLAENEAKCYLALFRKASMTVSETAKLSGVPRQNTYKALEKLLMKGMVISIPGRNKKFAASDPETFAMKTIDIFNANAQDEMAELERKIKSLQDIKLKEINDRKNAMKESLNNIVGELDSLYKSRDRDNPLDYIEILKDPYQADRLFEKYFSECRKELYGISKQRIRSLKDPILFRKFNKQIKLNAKHIKRGLSVRTIFSIWDDEESNKILCEKVIDKLVEAGEQVRVKANLPMRLTVFDNNIVMFTLIDPGSKDDKSSTVQVVKHPVFAQSFKIMYESLWNQAEDYSEFRKRFKW